MSSTLTLSQAAQTSAGLREAGGQKDTGFKHGNMSYMIVNIVIHGIVTQIIPYLEKKGVKSYVFSRLRKTMGEVSHLLRTHVTVFP